MADIDPRADEVVAPAYWPTPPRRRGLWVAVAVILAVLVVLLAFRGSLFPSGGSGTTPLAVHIVSDPSDAYAPANFQLTAEVSGGEGPYVYTWSDGATTLGRASSILVTLNDPGNQTVSLTVVDAAGSQASAQAVVPAVSPIPTAAVYVPASQTVDTVLLTIRWESASPVSACALEAWGALDVPRFAQCAGEGGVTSQGTGSSVAFEPDPDDPETTPVLFQSAGADVAIGVAWW